MSLPVLPPKYYRTHFFELIEFLETSNGKLIEEAQAKFLQKFRELSEDAQCVFIRMVNRKSNVFDRAEFSKYVEIQNPLACVQELQDSGFATSLVGSHVPNLIKFATKPKLQRWILANEISIEGKPSRDELVSLAQANLEWMQLEKYTGYESLVAQAYGPELEYLLFLAFGEIQESLSLYTLRDLGIRQTQSFKSDFKARFETLELAQTEYFFSKSLREVSNLSSLEEFMSLFHIVKSYENLSPVSSQLKNILLLEIAAAVENSKAEFSLEVLSYSHHPDARERAARILYRLDRKPECQELLEIIQQAPRNIEELIFAEDFEARKFGKKRLGYLTEILNSSREISLSEAFLKKPESGVQEFFEAQGYKTRFTENHLWVSLFGVLFWEELFESDKSAIFSSFERGPSDLAGSDFYLKHQAELEVKLHLLTNLTLVKSVLSETVEKKYGQLNNVFGWHKTLLEILVHFVEHSRTQDVSFVLRTMAKQFTDYHSGFPDLMIEKDGVLSFIEVKAEGDSLRMNQVVKLRLLKEAGFEVEVLKVKWLPDPNQIYVVVDIETTGSQATYNRITEIGALKVQNGKVIDEFQTLINPGRKIPPFITQLTGITDDMVASAPSFSEIAAQFSVFLEGSIFVAHNVRFDYSFIQREFARNEIDFVRPQICTSAGMKKAYPGLPSYSLKNLTQHFQISLDSHHRAMCDARAAMELLNLMNEKRG